MRKNEAIWVSARNRWQINVQNDGNRKTFTSSTPGKKGKIEAEKKADKWIETKSQNENIRLEKLWADFLQVSKETTGTANYKKHEQIGRLWLLPKLKTKRVVNITEQCWQNCINAGFAQGLAKKSCQNIRGSITALLKYARKRRIPVEQIYELTVPKDAPKKEKNILQPDDINKLFSISHIIKYGKQEPAFFIHAWRFIVLTGLRRGELCGIRKNEDIIDNMLYIRRSINSDNEETKGKNENARRYMMLSQYALREIAAQEQMLKQAGIISPWLFPDELGQRLDPKHFYKKWHTYSKQHNIDCSIHEMRHTLISVAKSEIPEELLKQVVGHSKSMDTFGVYGHEVQGDLQRVANTLDSIFNSLIK